MKKKKDHQPEGELSQPSDEDTIGYQDPQGDLGLHFHLGTERASNQPTPHRNRACEDFRIKVKGKQKKTSQIKDVFCLVILGLEPTRRKNIVWIPVPQTLSLMVDYGFCN